MNNNYREENRPVILVVDDSKYMRRMMREFLERDGYEVVEAENGKDALFYYQCMKPDIVLMDYVMPEMDGVTACLQLKKLPEGNRIPIVMITSLGDEKSVDLAFEAGATDYISKPINWAVLRQRVRRLLRARYTEISLNQSEAFARSVINNALDGIITVDMKGIIMSFNPSAERIFGYYALEAIGKEINVLIPKFYCGETDDYFAIDQYVDNSQEMGINWEIVGRRKSGVTISLELTVSDFYIGREKFFTIVLRDITERQKYEEKIRHQAFHDTLTDLPNRLLLKERLNLEIAHAKNNNRMLAVMYLDLDRFKLINDTLGHDKGDLLLKNVAKRLTNCLHKDDTVARMGGDEFTLLLPGLEKEEDAVKVAGKILESIRKPFEIDEHELYISGSIGISFCPNDGEFSEDLLKNADVAMYRAKEKGKNNFQLYTLTMNIKARERLEMENNLRKALENKEFIVYYQPKIDTITKKIIGFEALVRWQHPEWGLVSPSKFIPLAEDTGLIVPIGEYVLRTACIQAKKWQDQGFAGLHVAVNLSSRQFQLQNLIKEISEVLKVTKLNPELLELEITETVAMQDVEYTLEIMSKLKGMGIKFAIDDFGTGYSSLSYLKKFSLNKLKIDKSFVQEIDSKTGDKAIASTIIALGKSLNLDVVAEGVENEGQYDFLKKSECDEMQGFLFGKPMPASEFTSLLMSRKKMQEMSYTS